ncbi:MAG: hypothetical protein CME71_09105 [Halobacteriovorax sp.]|nr:hypothetical protein [Halobacteriovorax sp.]|tara:strand:+ start:285 stop:815 length:531 start_codon:yes stop_codon:yes gene_type:complete
MKKLILISLLSLISFNLLAQTTVTTVSNRRTGETIAVNCVDQCSSIEFVLNSDETKEVLSRLDQNDYAKMIDALSIDDRALVKDNFFFLMQGFTKLPWDNQEFIMLYFIGAGVTVPLTAIALGIDVAILPLGVAAYGIDLLNGNVGRKLARKIRKKKSMKLDNFRFNSLVDRLRHY